MKTTFTARINTKGSCKGDTYRFDFSTTKNIPVCVAENTASVEVAMNTVYKGTFKDTKAYNAIKEGIKRILLIHLMKYGTDLSIRSINIEIRQGKKQIASFAAEKDFSLFTILDRKRLRPIPASWNNEEAIRNVMAVQKTSRDSRIAALYAFLSSKSMNYEFERFVYNWMAVNGMYSAIHPESQTIHTPKGREKTPNDNDKLGSLAKKYGYGTSIGTKAHRNEIAGKAVSLLISAGEIDDVVAQLSSVEETPLQKAIADLFADKNKYPEYDLTAKGYMITDFAYYLRCTLIHANKPLPLYSFSDDWEIRILSIVNRMLEDFLNEHLIDLLRNTNA